jgi:DNA repair protein RadC
VIAGAIIVIFSDPYGGSDQRHVAVLAALLNLIEIDSPELHARRLIDEFGAIDSVLAADPAVIGKMVRSQRASEAIRMVAHIHQAALRAALETPKKSPECQAVTNYLVASMAHKNEEEVRVLFYKSGSLLREDRVAVGSHIAVGLAPRNIIHRALNLGSDGLVIAHNHPSGDARASNDDISATRTLSRALAGLDIRILDHLVIARGRATSFKEMGIM